MLIASGIQISAIKLPRFVAGPVYRLLGGKDLGTALCSRRPAPRSTHARTPWRRGSRWLCL